MTLFSLADVKPCDAGTHYMARLLPKTLPSKQRHDWVQQKVSGHSSLGDACSDILKMRGPCYPASRAETFLRDGPPAPARSCTCTSVRVRVFA